MELTSKGAEDRGSRSRDAGTSDRNYDALNMEFKLLQQKLGKIR